MLRKDIVNIAFYEGRLACANISNNEHFEQIFLVGLIVFFHNKGDLITKFFITSIYCVNKRAKILLNKEFISFDFQRPQEIARSNHAS